MLAPFCTLWTPTGASTKARATKRDRIAAILAQTFSQAFSMLLNKAIKDFHLIGSASYAPSDTKINLERVRGLVVL